MEREEILRMVDLMTEEELIIFRDEILKTLRTREAEKDPPAEARPEE